MSERAPRQQVIEVDLDALATDAEATVVAGEVEITGEVSEVTWTPRANLTGAATNHRALSVINKGLDGNGATVIATLAFDSGVNALDFDELTIPLSEVEDALDVVPGQQLAVASTAPGSGIADPGGKLRITIQGGAV